MHNFNYPLLTPTAVLSSFAPARKSFLYCSHFSSVDVFLAFHMSVFPKCACEVKDFPSIQSFLGYFESRIVNFWHIKAKYLAPPVA